MKVRQHFELPPDKQEDLKNARRLQMISLAMSVTVVGVMYAAVSGSQAMKAAWVEDILALIPPTVFLLAERWQGRPPSARFPYGRHNAGGLAFLAAASTVCVFGLFLFIHSTMALLSREHPTIPSVRLAGEEVWMGWLMLAALAYSGLVPVVLGRLKLRLARRLYDETLLADATLNKADWMTALAAGAGVVGIGYGLWWADAVAAILISLDVIHDGVYRFRGAILDLLGERPNAFESDEEDPVIARLRETLQGHPLVREADVRLHTEGRLLAAEAFVVFGDGRVAADQVEEVRQAGLRVDWRLRELVVTPVARL